MPCQGSTNRRVLLIDDSKAIHEDFAKILAPARATPDLQAAEALLFGAEGRDDEAFELDSAYQGTEGLARVEAALRCGRPYALAFVDMRMPPGWDGMETVERLWQADPRLQVVICTAYSDHAWEEVLDRVAVEDRLLILKKPFDLIEVSQLARALAAKWSLARRAEAQQQLLEARLGELRASELALRCAIRDLDTFACAVAHDLQGPLARIQSFAGLLEEQVPGGASGPAHYLDRIRANAAIGEDLVRGVLGLAEIARAEPSFELVDVGAIVEAVFAQLGRDAPQRAVSLHVRPGLRAWADRRLLQTALAHLVGNCWKFTAGCEAARIEFGLAESSGEEAVFFLRDNGCGFEPDHADRLFRKFVRLHGQAYPGAGVGLVTVSRILQRHGGRVWAESAPGQGTTFRFSLPLARPEAQRS